MLYYIKDVVVSTSWHDEDVEVFLERGIDHNGIGKLQKIIAYGIFDMKMICYILYCILHE